MKYLTLTILLGLLAQTCSEEQDRQWLTIDPIQCFSNPWEQAWLEENNNNPTLLVEMDEQQRLQVFKQYYQTLGFTIYKVEQTFPYETGCDACSCKRGDRIHCQVDQDDVEQMMELGFELQ